MGSWGHPTRAVRDKTFVIIAAPGMEENAKWLQTTNPEKFQYFETEWGHFPDGTDNIKVGGFPVDMKEGDSLVRERSILFLASFDNNDMTLSQYHVMVMLLETFIQDMTVVLPYFPTGTMERVMEAGSVATANTLSKMFSYLPTVGRPTRVMVYDIHSPQNQFYFSNNALMTLHSAFPMLVDEISAPHSNIDAVAFPDDGAAKRFGGVFKKAFPDMELITCGKLRDPDDPLKRTVSIQDGNPKDRHIIIVDDLVQSGGTLYECGQALKNFGAAEVSAFVTHAVFPNDSWRRFAAGGDRNVFKTFYVSDSRPTTVKHLPIDDCFQIFPLAPLIAEDL